MMQKQWTAKTLLIIKAPVWKKIVKQQVNIASRPWKEI